MFQWRDRSGRLRLRMWLAGDGGRGMCNNKIELTILRFWYSRCLVPSTMRLCSVEQV